MGRAGFYLDADLSFIILICNMKKLVLVSVLLCAISYLAGADDIITKLDGEIIKAKITEVGNNVVKYKRMDNPNGPVYVLNFSEIKSVEYENGTIENYNESVPEEPHYYKNESFDVRYRDISSIYNPRYYKEQSDDPYVPALSGLASFLIPGLGQCIDGEWGRGIGIFAANMGFGLLEATEASVILYSAAEGSSYYKNHGEPSVAANTIMGVSLCAGLITAASHLFFNVWNICDAVNIAKVKNMYYQDVQMTPQFALVPSIGTGLTPTAGVSLTLSF